MSLATSLRRTAVGMAAPSGVGAARSRPARVRLTNAARLDQRTARLRGRRRPEGGHVVVVGAASTSIRRWRAPPAMAKELHFFDRCWESGFAASDIALYARYFPRPGGALAGEWTPGYMIDFWTPG